MSVTFYSDKDRDGINVSNTNARELLAAMDIPAPEDDGIIGQMVGIEFAARAERAIETVKALGMNEARPSYETRGAGGCLMIECGRREGYLENRLTHLRDLGLLTGEGLIHYC